MMPGMNMGMNMFPGMRNQPFMQQPGNFIQKAPVIAGTSLFVGNIDSSITDSLLYQIFIPFGEITSLRIMKDSYTKVSREFGFVTFTREEDAKKAQKALNNTYQFGRELRVNQKINLKDLPKNSNVIIKNLAKTINSKTLEQHCTQFGEILSCFVKTDSKSGKSVSLGFGFVQFTNSENAQKCVEALNDSEISGEKITAEIYIPRNMRSTVPCSNLYIKQFPDSWDKEKIQEFLVSEFGKFGTITSSTVSMEATMKKMFAFVSFATAEEASKATAEMNNKEIEGATLYVNVAQSKLLRRKQLIQQRMKLKNETNIYIRSLKHEITEEVLKKVFGKYGEITSMCLRDWIKPQMQGNHIYIH